MKKKGCFYWLLIGWWFEPIYHILSKWCGAGIIFKTILYCSLFLILGTLLVGAYAFIALFLIIASVIGFVIKYFSSKCLSNVNFDSMTGIEFENFCAIILRNNGFRNVQITKASGDHGIDILANKNGKKYAIQCKRYTNSVGNSAIQEAYSGCEIYNADIAVVMTNSHFTKQAISDASKLNVILWDKNILLKMANSTASENTSSKKLNIAESKISDEAALQYAAMCEKYAREQDYMERLGISKENTELNE